MKFALLGDHPDGLSMTRALVESGRHQLSAYCGPSVGAEYLKLWSLSTQRFGDAEEVLADPAIDAVIVAGSPALRPAQLRRAVQSERHVLCVHPSDENPNAAYEASMIQAETRKVLMPLVAQALHPGIRRLTELAREPRLIEFTSPAPERETDADVHDLALPGWEVLRTLGGEIVELIGLAETEELIPDSPTMIMGRFQLGGLFRMTFLPGQAEPWRLVVLSAAGKSELSFPDGWPGKSELTWIDEAGTSHRETWEPWNPWLALVEQFERRIESQSTETYPTWQDEIRALELDVAARRSIEKRRASTLEYQEATEEASFKGAMTLVGCSLLWVSLVLLIVSAWVPLLGWAIAPVFGVFLLLQLLRWIVPAKEIKAPPPPLETKSQSSSLSSAIRPRK